MSRTLVISDVHANAPALEAVLDAEPDRDSVIFLGDAVDNGPHPDVVCDRLRNLDLLASVDGNHDRTVLDASEASEPSSDPFVRWQEWTYAQLSAENRAFLESLERTTTVDLDDKRVRLHHGDFQPPADHQGAWPTRVTPEDDVPTFETVAARYDEDVVLHGHSHYPFEATVAGTTFVNPGSVGLQREGWPKDRARYATLEDGTAHLRSVPYDSSPVAADSRTLDSPFSDLWGRSGTSAGAE